MKYKDFSINDLQSFITAYETHNLSKCGELLYVSRQSVARSISKIETAVGTELFTRNEKGIFPNVHADAVYQSARKIIESVDELIRSGEDKARQKKPVFAVIGHYKAGLDIEEKLTAYAGRHPSFQFEVLHFKWPEIVSKVLDGSVDFAYVASGTYENCEQLDFIPIRDAQMVTPVLKSGAAEAVGSISAEVFFQKPVFLLSFFSIEQKILEDYFREHSMTGQAPVPTADFWFVDSILKSGTQSVLVMSGLADRLIALNPDYELLPLDPPVIRHSGFICRKGRLLTDELESVLEYLRSSERNGFHP